MPMPSLLLLPCLSQTVQHHELLRGVQHRYVRRLIVEKSSIYHQTNFQWGLTGFMVTIIYQWWFKFIRQIMLSYGRRPPTYTVCGVLQLITRVRQKSPWISYATCRKYVKSENNNIESDPLQITLRTIASAGFGQRASWTATSGSELAQGQHMPLIDAVELAAELIWPRGWIPEWLLDLGLWVHIPILGPTLRAVRRSYAGVKFGLLEIVSNARTQILDGKAATLDAALLTNMVKANMAASAGEEDVRQLTDNELLSNAIVGLLALTIKPNSEICRYCFLQALVSFHEEIFPTCC